MTAAVVLTVLAVVALVLVGVARLVFRFGFQVGGNDARMLQDIAGDDRAQDINDATDCAITSDDYEADRRSWL